MRTPRFLPGMSAHSRGFLLVLLAAFCYGLQPLFASFAYAGGANPIGLLLARFSIAAAVLLALLHRQRIGLPSLRLVRQNLLLGVGYGLAALGYYSASRASSVSLAIILVYSFPAFVTLVSIAWLGERTSLLKLFSLLLALGGVALATGLSLAGASIGALWALFAAMAYTSELVSSAQLGLGLAFAIAIDATVVRLILLPATMRLFGEANWWLPAWLERSLPNVAIH